jgi:hypothetical protein
MTHSIKNIAKYIDQSRFEVFLASADRTCYGPEVLPYFKPENILTYPREPGWMYEYDPKTGEYGPPVDEHPLYDWLLEKKIDIIHDNRSGTYFFPLSSPKIIAKKIEYNVFGGADLSTDIARTICISRGVYNDWVAQMKRRAPHLVSRAVMINPAVSLPETDENLRQQLGISEELIVIGRSSNAGRGDTFNFLGFREIEDDRTIFLSPATDVNQVEQIKNWGIKRIMIIPTILNYRRMSMYYNTLDISAHHRGESFGGCVSSDTILNVLNTSKEMQEIKVGDMVLSEEGLYNRVNRIFVRHSPNYYILKTYGNFDLKITGNHPVRGVKRTLRTLGRFLHSIKEDDLEWIPVEGLHKEDYIAVTRPKLDVPLLKTIDMVEFLKDENLLYDDTYVWYKFGVPSSKNKNEFSLKKIQDKYGVSKRVAEDVRMLFLDRIKGHRCGKNSVAYSIYQQMIQEGIGINPNLTGQKFRRFIPLDEKFLYILGWYVAEGSCGGGSVEFSLNKNEKNICETLKLYIEELCEHKCTIEIREEMKVSRLTVSSLLLKRLFSKLAGTLAHNKVIHPILMRSGRFLLPMISSVFNGDGHCAVNYWQIALVSKVLILQLRDILLSNGIYPCVQLSKKERDAEIKGRKIHCKKAWGLSIGGIEHEKLCTATGLKYIVKVSRSRVNRYKTLDSCILVPIHSIEKLQKELKVYDIEVENSHSFTGNGITLHNSVAEACLHGKPVVTAGWCNRQYNPATAQEELIYEREYCAEGSDERSYSIAYGAILRRLINGGREYCRQEGLRFRERAMGMCAAPKVVKELEALYEEVMNE